MLGVTIACASEFGRRASNEDQVRVCRDGAHWIAVLADGAGGHRGGAEAALRAVDQVPQALQGSAAQFGPETLTRAVRAAHQHVRAGRAPGGPRIHTTLVVLWLDAASGRALWAHVGDSRLYRVRRGGLRLLTSDDSLVQRMVDAGLLTRAQALVHPHRNQLVAALGIEGEVEPHTLAEAVTLEPGDAFLLCSDGWWGALDEAGILGCLADADTPQEWLQAMQRLIEARGQEYQDNFSAIALWVGQRVEAVDEETVTLAVTPADAGAQGIGAERTARSAGRPGFPPARE